jgi:hypothetical protein
MELLADVHVRNKRHSPAFLGHYQGLMPPLLLTLPEHGPHLCTSDLLRLITTCGKVAQPPGKHWPASQLGRCMAASNVAAQSHLTTFLLPQLCDRWRSTPHVSPNDFTDAAVAIASLTEIMHTETDTACALFHKCATKVMRSLQLEHLMRIFNCMVVDHRLIPDSGHLFRQYLYQLEYVVVRCVRPPSPFLLCRLLGTFATVRQHKPKTFVTAIHTKQFDTLRFKDALSPVLAYQLYVRPCLQ